MLLAAERAPLGEAHGGQLVGSRGLGKRQGVVVAGGLHALDVGHGKATHARGGAREVAVDELVGEADDLEDLRGVVALEGRDAHLGHDRRDARGHGLVVVGHGRVGVKVAERAPGREVADALVGHVGVDAAGGVAHERGEVVGAEGVAGLHHDVCEHAHAGADEVVVHAAQREQAGDGHLAGTRAVGEHHDVHARAHRGLDVGVQLGERLLERVGTGLALVGGVEDLRLEAHAVDGADAAERVVGEHRALQAHEAAGVAAVLEQVAVVAEVEHAGGHEALAQRVDGRVGHLGEELVEVVVERAVLLREHRERRVDAHRGQRRLAGRGHGANALVHVVVVVAQLCHALGEWQALVRLGGQFVCGRLAQVADVEGLVAQPVAVGLLVGVLVADLVVPDDAALPGVDLEHLARAQAARAQDVLGLHVDGAHLGGEDEAVVAGHVVARGAQAVSIEHGAEHGAIGEHDGGRAVPRLHEHGLVGVVGAALLRELGVVVPGLGHHEGHGAVERATVHREELEHVVENRGVGALAVDDGQHLLQVVLEDGAVEVWLAGANPGDVAAQRVDLAVVDDVAVGVRALPAGRGVGGVARVHEGQRRLHGRVVEVGEEAAHLRGHEHALVHDGAAGHGAHVEDLALEGGVLVGGALDGAAGHVELALEVLAGCDVVRATQERLQDGGHAGLGGVAQVVRVDGHAAPEHERHAAGGAALLEHADGRGDAVRVADAVGLARLVVVREEEHGHAVVALVGQEVALLLGLLAEEAVRHLEEHAGAVAGVALEALAPAMLEVDEHGERVVECLVAANALELRDGADAAGVMVVAGAIEAAGGLRTSCAVVGRAGGAGGRTGHAGRESLLMRLHVSVPSPMEYCRSPKAAPIRLTRTSPKQPAEHSEV